MHVPVQVCGCVWGVYEYDLENSFLELPPRELYSGLENNDALDGSQSDKPPIYCALYSHTCHTHRDPPVTLSLIVLIAKFSCSPLMLMKPHLGYNQAVSEEACPP